MSAYPQCDKYSSDEGYDGRFAIKQTEPANVSITTIKPTNLLNILFILIRLIGYVITAPFNLAWVIIVFVFTFKFQHRHLIYWTEDNRTTKYKGEFGSWTYGYYNPIKWIIRAKSYDATEFVSNDSFD